MIMTLDEVKSMPPLSKKEMDTIDRAKPTPTEDCPEMSEKELGQFHPWYSRQKKSISINIDVEAIEYFKGLSSDTGVPYQTLINMYLVQCKEERKRPVFV